MCSVDPDVVEDANSIQKRLLAVTRQCYSVSYYFIILKIIVFMVRLSHYKFFLMIIREFRLVDYP